MAGHHQDRRIVGATCGQLGEDSAAEEWALGNGTLDYERVLDLGYRIQLTNLAYVQRDIQYVLNSGGTGDIQNAARRLALNRVQRDGEGFRRRGSLSDSRTSVYKAIQPIYSVCFLNRTLPKPRRASRAGPSKHNALHSGRGLENGGMA